MVKCYEKYKDSGIAWIGEIPEHWEMCRIKFIGEIRGRIGFRGYNVSDLVDSTTKGRAIVLGGTNIMSAGYVSFDKLTYITEHKFLESPEIMLKGGEILITKVGAGTGENAIYEWHSERVTINPNVMMLICRQILPRFINYFLMSDYIKKMVSMESCKCGAQPAINQSFINNMQCQFPLLVPEQEQIAKYLDWKCEEVDRIVQVRERQIKLLSELRTSVISRAVTRGLDPNAPLKDSGIAWIGEIPEHWEIRRIKSFCIVKRGASPRPIDDDKYFDDNGEFAWVRISDASASERYLLNTTQRLSTLGASLSVKRFPGDIFLSIAGTVGKSIITKIKCCIHDGFVWFMKLDYNKELLYYIFESGQPYLGLGKMGTQLNLNTDTVGNIFIPYMNKHEQQQIAAYLDKKTAEIDSTIEKFKAQIDKIKEYRQALITEVVTGKIDVRGIEIPAPKSN